MSDNNVRFWFWLPGDFVASAMVPEDELPFVREATQNPGTYEGCV